jgi:branched-chain amino acid aminotransferase
VSRDHTVLVAIDGELVAPAQATVSVFDRGFLYGDSVFETTRTYGGVPFMLAEHLSRLRWSADRLGFELPLTTGDLVGEVARLAELGRARVGGELTLRLMVTRGEGTFGLDPFDASEPRRVLFIAPLKVPPASAYRDGVGAVCVPSYRPSDAARGAKVGNYLESILALRVARATGAHEALIVSADGHITEGTTSNVFALIDGALVTPPLYETILPGITRALVIAAAHKLELPVVERRMEPHDLAGAEEAFITSSIREILPLSNLDGYAIGEGRPGAMTRRLHEVLRRDNALVGAPPWE